MPPSMLGSFIGKKIIFMEMHLKWTGDRKSQF